MKNALSGDLVTPRKPSPGGLPVWTPYARCCPTRFVLDRVADKWTMLLLDLLARRPMRFNALLREVEGLTQKVLSQTLKRLERDGLITRTAFATVPVTVEYRITPLGTTLAGSVSAVVHWAENNIEQVLASQRSYDERAGAAD